MWSHLERQAGGKVRGMGEKQIEVDKRLLRTRMGQLRRSLDDVRMHRKQYRERRAQVCCTACHSLPELQGPCGTWTQWEFAEPVCQP